MSSMLIFLQPRTNQTHHCKMPDKTLHIKLYYVLSSGNIWSESDVGNPTLSETSQGTIDDFIQGLSPVLGHSRDDSRYIALTSNTSRGHLSGDTGLLDIVNGCYGENAPAAPMAVFLFGAWSFRQQFGRQELLERLNRCTNLDEDLCQKFLRSFSGQNKLAADEMSNTEFVPLPSFEESLNDPVIEVDAPPIEDSPPAYSRPLTAAGRTRQTLASIKISVISLTTSQLPGLSWQSEVNLGSKSPPEGEQIPPPSSPLIINHPFAPPPPRTLTPSSKSRIPLQSVAPSSNLKLIGVHLPGGYPAD